MAKKCEYCGAEHIEDEGWAKCRDCGKIYCPDCAGKMDMERRDIQTLREGDAFERLMVLCPSCSLDMLRSE